MKRALAFLVVLAGLGAGATYVVKGRATVHGDDVATYTVTKTKFVRRVAAEGNLRALKATSLQAPNNGGTGQDRVARGRRHARQAG